MKFIYTVAFSVATALAVAGQPLLDFSDPAVVKGSRFVSSSGGSASLEPIDGGVRLRFKDVVDAKLLSASLQNRIAEMKPEERPVEFYLTYRVRSFEGSGSVRFFAPYPCTHTAAFKRTGSVETMRLRPGIVSMRKSRQYDRRELTSAVLLVSGSGD